MNLKLKLRIIEKYGGQWKFAAAVGEHESVISKMVRERIYPSDERKKIYAEALDCDVREIFE